MRHGDDDAPDDDDDDVNLSQLFLLPFSDDVNQSTHSTAAYCSTYVLLLAQHV